MGDVVDGTVRGLGKPYADGTPRYEIWVPIGRTGSLPLRVDERVPVRLRVAGAEFCAGLRSTTDNKYAQVCPDVVASGGAEDKLGRVLTAAGFEVNDPVQLLVTGDVVEVRRAV